MCAPLWYCAFIYLWKGWWVIHSDIFSFADVFASGQVDVIQILYLMDKEDTCFPHVPWCQNNRTDVTSIESPWTTCNLHMKTAEMKPQSQSQYLLFKSQSIYPKGIHSIYKMRSNNVHTTFFIYLFYPRDEPENTPLQILYCSILSGWWHL